MQNIAKFGIAAIGLAVASCSGTMDNRTMYSVHQPVVSRATYVIDLNASGGGLPTSERARLNEWMGALGAGYGDRVAIDYGSTYGDGAIRAAVTSVAAQYDAQYLDTAPVTQGAVIPGTVRVVLTRSAASVPNCPDWSKKSEANYNGGNHSNYGCAINSNLAAMVADPEDLVRGQDAHAHDSTRGVGSVEAYRAKTGEPK